MANHFVRKVLWVLLLCIGPMGSPFLFGQAAPAKTARSAGAEQPAALLEEATALRADKPQRSIRLLNRLIQRETDPDQLAAAFTLLGDIFVDIGEWASAIDRYNQALNLASGKNPGVRAALYAKLGNAHLSRKNYLDAESSFNNCLILVDSTSSIGLQCQEGLADLAVARLQLDLSQSIYNTVQTNRPNDPLLQSRVAAKRANVYVQQNDYENAQLNYQIAVEQLPKTDLLQPKDYEDVLLANRELNAALPKLNLSDSLAFVETTTNSAPALPDPIVINDNLARFDRARDENDPVAEKLLNDAILRVDENTAASLTTELYREGAEYYLARNDPKRAAEIYRRYITANDSLLAEQRRDLALQSAILKEQQGVDLSLKDLAAAARERTLLSDQIQLQRWLIIALGALLLGALISVLFILRNVRKRRRASQELLLRSLQGQMNPHFIFNSLNSINNFIAQQDERSANRFLGRFAKLMRNVLDQSGKTFVPVAEEIEQLQLYLELEAQRFGGQFEYHLEVPNQGIPAAGQELEIPPMLIQPFVENAIWHGLRYRPDRGDLMLRFDFQAQGLWVIIRDNGIGRQKSQELKTVNQRKHRSTGMENTRQRIQLINNLYKQQIKLDITDAAAPDSAFPGTEVKLQFPYPS